MSPWKYLDKQNRKESDVKKTLETIELIALVVVIIGMIAADVAKAVSLWGTHWLIFVWMGFKLIGVVILLLVVFGCGGFILFILSTSVWKLCFFLAHCDRESFRRKIYAFVPLIAATLGTIAAGFAIMYYYLLFWRLKGARRLVMSKDGGLSVSDLLWLSPVVGVILLLVVIRFIGYFGFLAGLIVSLGFFGVLGFGFVALWKRAE